MMRLKIGLLLVFIAVLFSDVAMAAPAGLAGLSPDMDYVAGEVLVVPRGIPSSQALGSMGMSITSEYRGHANFMRVKTAAGQTVQDAMATLSGQPWVAHVQPNYIYRASLLPNDLDFPKYWALNNTGQIVNGVGGTPGADIDALTAWDRVTDCSSVVVAVTDTGIDYNHPDLAGNIWSNTAEAAGLPNVDDDGNGYTDDIRGWDFIQSDNDPMDFHYHGTHVAGTIGATGNNATGGTGVCWNVQLMPLRVLGSVGQGTTADLKLAIDYAVNNGANVINMSLGGPGGAPGDLLDQAIAAARAAGVLVVAAAGNENSNNDTSPRYPTSYNQDNIISVAATDQNDALASFSNFGAASVDVASPGVNIYSTVPPDRTVVYSEGFETGSLGWAFETRDTSTNPSTNIANSVGFTTEDKFSGVFSLTDTPGSNYENNRSYRARSPAYDLTGGLDGVVLSFMLNLDTETSFDVLNVDGSSGGVSWNALPTDIFLSGHSNGWFPVSADMRSLQGAASAYIRFRLETDGSTFFDGFHIDDMQITVPGTTYIGTEYGYLQGTSMATPHVSGLAALIWAAEPGLTYVQVRSRILGNGDPITMPFGKRTVTNRRINARMSMPLDAPTGLVLTSLPSKPRFAVVSLDWTDNAISEDAYLIQRDDGSGFVTIASPPADTTAYVDNIAPPETTVSYRVVAKARDGRTLNGTAQNITTSAATGIVIPGSSGGCLVSSSGRLPWLTILPVMLLAGIKLTSRKRQL